MMLAYWVLVALIAANTVFTVFSKPEPRVEFTTTFDHFSHVDTSAFQPHPYDVFYEMGHGEIRGRCGRFGESRLCIWDNGRV